MSKIAIIGGGNLGAAIAKGLLKTTDNHPAQIYITRNKIERLDYLKQQGVVVSRDNVFAVKAAEIIILAVKPYKILEVLDEIAPHLEAHHILASVATGIRLSQIKSKLNAVLPVFRLMPNTAIEIQESITCLCAEDASKEHIEKIQILCNSLGESILIEEELMEAATVLGACGIAFVLRFIRAMMQAGIEIGFDALTATKIAEQTVKGAAELLKKGGKHPEEEIDKVTTPKGCTISGLNEMEHRGFSSSLIKLVTSSPLTYTIKCVPPCTGIAFLILLKGNILSIVPWICAIRVSSPLPRHFGA